MLRGVNAIAQSEPVALAFESLYEDLAPVRFACDVLYWRLERPLADAASHSSVLLEARSSEDLAAARELFEDGSGTLDRDELLSNALLRSLGHCEGCTCEGIHNCRSVDKFMQDLDADGDGSITFLEFMLSASRVLFGGRRVAEAGPEVIEALLVERGKNKDKVKDLERRFQGILATIRSWEGTEVSKKVLEENSSRARVLEGLLTGAKIPDLAKALQVMYVDYFPLRVGGDSELKDCRSNLTAAEAAISACSRCTQWPWALELFERAHRGSSARSLADAFTFNATMASCGKGQQWKQSLHLFTEMQRTKHRPDKVTYGALVGACEKASEWRKALAFFSQMGADRDAISCATLISACERGRKWEEAMAFLEIMKCDSLQPSAILHGVVIGSCIKSGKLEEGLGLYQSMLEEMVPHEITTSHSVAIVRCCQYVQYA
eukprot:g17354.t1